MTDEKKSSRAIALKYEPQIDSAPRIIAKGRGFIAELIKEIAIKYDIPIYEDKLLVELLEKIEINYEIPEFLYEVIAELLAFTYNIGRKEGIQI